MKTTVWIHSSVLWALLGGPLAHAPQAEESGDIARIKAAYVYHFANFAEWPAEKEKYIRLCTLGEGEVANRLQDLDERELEQGRILRVVVRPPREEIAKACDMLFIGQNLGAELDPPAAMRLQLGALLSVSDRTGFAKNGGMIEMFLRDDKVRMRVNLDVVRASGIRLSSKLLRLAEIVETP